MPFRPNVNDTLAIGKATYRFTEHPSAKGMPYGQSGRRGTVYQICADEGGTLLALKVFTQSFRVPRVAEGTSALRAYAKLPGLQVCARLALTPGQFPQLLAQHPDLEYAVVMPWVEGKTWQEILLEKEVLSRAQSLQVAKAFAHILIEMENRGVAHCDLSGPNVMIKGEETPEPQVALVDVEDLFAENLKRPEKLSGGSSGYSHKDASKGLWQASADRFAGSILLAEMLGWCDEDIRSHSFDEQYFPPSEMQVSCERYEQLYGTLQTQWGNPIANLFARAWFSETLDECPTLTEWQRAIIVLDPNVIPKQYVWNRVGEEKRAEIPKQVPQSPEPIAQPLVTPSIAPSIESKRANQRAAIPPSPKKRRFPCVLVAAFIGVCSLMMVAGGIWGVFGEMPSFPLSNVTMPIHLPELVYGTSTPTQNWQATATKQEQNNRTVATQIARQATKNARPAPFSLVPDGVLSDFSQVEFFETFDKPGDWEVGEDDDEFGSSSQKIQNGSYIYSADLVKERYISGIPIPGQSIPLRDFYFQVDARRIEGSEDNCYGLVFRDTEPVYGEEYDEYKYYLLEVCDDKYFHVRRSVGEEWIDISEWINYSVIKTGKFNRIGVSAKGNQFNIIINDQYAYSFKDDNLPNAGYLELAVLPSTSPSSFEFDNVIVLVP